MFICVHLWRIYIPEERNTALPKNQPPYLQSWSAEIQQQAKRQPRRPKVIQALRHMHRVECFDRLQLNDHRVLNQQVGAVFTGLSRSLLKLP